MCSGELSQLHNEMIDWVRWVGCPRQDPHKDLAKPSVNFEAMVSKNEAGKHMVLVPMKH